MNVRGTPLRLATLAATAAVALLSGCAIGMKVPVKAPTPSEARYTANGAAAPVALVFKDNRPDPYRANVLHGSTLPMTLEADGKPFEAVPWVATHVVAELKARGLPVTLGAEGAAGTGVAIRQLRVQNHRASGFSPFITFTSLSADLDTPRGPQRIVAYVKRAKVPVMSFDEVIDPTYNDALAILTKEVAAKINRELFGQAITDAQVQALVAKIAKDATTRADAYLDVYQLGFGNNRSAVPELVKLTSHASEYVRLAALSSLGTLKATDQFDLLVQRFENRTGLWQDRAMALKAIGDLGTPAAVAYLEKQQQALEKSTDKESTWNKEILGLYLGSEERVALVGR